MKLATTRLGTTVSATMTKKWKGKDKEIHQREENERRLMAMIPKPLIIKSDFFMSFPSCHKLKLGPITGDIFYTTKPNILKFWRKGEWYSVSSTYLDRIKLIDETFKLLPYPRSRYLVVLDGGAYFNIEASYFSKEGIRRMKAYRFELSEHRKKFYNVLKKEPKVREFHNEFVTKLMEKGDY